VLKLGGAEEKRYLNIITFKMKKKQKEQKKKRQKEQKQKRGKEW
jgi:hypothetical protein